MTDVDCLHMPYEVVCKLKGHRFLVFLSSLFSQKRDIVNKAISPQMKTQCVKFKNVTAVLCVSSAVSV
jgi:hypothetical protein